MTEKKVRKITINVSEDIGDRIDDWRFDNRIGNLTKALKVIISKGLDVVEAEQSAQK